MTAESTDEELMAAYIEQGSESAFLDLYRRYEGRLFGFLVKRLASPMRDRASDLFQKTWLKVHVSRHQFQVTRRFSPWLFSIALNCLRDEFKRRGVHEEERGISGEDFDVPSADDDTERLLLRKEDGVALERALAELPGQDREALLLSEWEGFGPDELSGLWQISNAAARQRVSRARKKAQRILMKSSGIGGDR